MGPSGSLTLKILSVNLLAPVLLVIGLFYIEQYQTNLIDRALSGMKAETQLYAGALTESVFAPQKQPGTRPEFILERARRLVDALALSSGDRLRLYDSKGELLADSARRGQGGEVIKIEPLSPLPPEEAKTKGIQAPDILGWMRRLPITAPLPRLPEEDGEKAVFENVLNMAREGQTVARAYLDENAPDHRITMVAATQLRDQSNVRGYLIASHEGADILTEIAQIRLEILRLSGLALLVTLILSFYLAREIGMPLRKLARAAKSIRKGQKIGNIPVFTNRHDEIGTLSLAMRDMTKALGERLDNIEKFAGDVSHELKNPLSSLRSATETLKLYQGKSETSPEQERLMEVLIHDIDRMNRLITDISTSSRLDVALERESRTAVDVKELISGIIELQSMFNRENAVALYDSSDGQCVVFGNSDRLAQVFQNLIDNALSFSPPDSNVKITLQNDKNWLVIQLRDYGPGIPEDKLENIFDRFYSERPGHEDYGAHSGLGLAIARQIVMAHDGDIRAQNIYEKGEIRGALFTVRLPVA